MDYLVSKYPLNTKFDLSRFLKAHEYNIFKAEKMFASYLNWKMNFVSNIKKKNLMVAIKAKLIYHYGYSKNGHPICYVELDKMVDSYETEIMNYTVYFIENILSHKQKEFIWIVDFSNFNVKYIKLKSNVIKLIDILTKKYPKLLKRLYLVNVPSIFHLIKPIIFIYVNKKIMSKIIYSHKDKFLQYLKDDIDINTLNISYGGNMIISDYIKENLKLYLKNECKNVL